MQSGKTPCKRILSSNGTTHTNTHKQERQELTLLPVLLLLTYTVTYFIVLILQTEGSKVQPEGQSKHSRLIIIISKL